MCVVCILLRKKYYAELTFIRLEQIPINGSHEQLCLQCGELPIAKQVFLKCLLLHVCLCPIEFSKSEFQNMGKCSWWSVTFHSQKSIYSSLCSFSPMCSFFLLWNLVFTGYMDVNNFFCYLFQISWFPGGVCTKCNIIHCYFSHTCVRAHKKNEYGQMA